MWSNFAKFIKRIQIHKKSLTVKKFIVSEKLHCPFKINPWYPHPFSKTDIPFSQPSHKQKCGQIFNDMMQFTSKMKYRLITYLENSNDICDKA